MKKLILLSVVILLCGCSPQRRLARLLERFPPDTLIRIEYRDHTVYKDTTIFKYLPGEVVTDSIIVEKLIEKRVKVPYTSIYAETMLAEATASIENNKLKLELIQRDSLFVFLLDSAIREHSDTTIITNDVPYPVIEKEKTFWRHGFFILAGILALILLLVFVRKRR